MTPQELHAEFVSIYEQFPYSIARDQDRTVPVTQDPAVKTLERRESSEHRKVLFARLEALLAYSPTTQSFKRKLLGSLELWYLVGRPEDVFPHLGKPAYFDSERSEEGGIFMQPRAKEIERGEYHRAVKGSLAVRTLGEKMFGEVDDAELKDENITRWRQEFIDLYGEEP